MVEMFGVDIGDDRNRAVEPQETAVALVRLDHHPVARAKPGVRTVAVDDAAVDDRRVDAAMIEHRRDQRCGRRLAMRTSHGDGF